MGCPANPKKFLGFIPYEGRHVWRLLSLKLGAAWTAKHECEQCHSQKETWPLKDEDIIRAGFDIEALRERMSGTYVKYIGGEELQALLEGEN